MAYSTIKDPSAHFQTLLWTGNDVDGRALTNDGNSNLKPDLVWLKNRNVGYNHFLVDSSRGTSVYLSSNTTTADTTWTNLVESFDTNGFTVGDDGSQVPNHTGNTFVGWQWKANGGTTSTNNDGSITTTTQVNSDAGFSIVTWAGGGTGSLGHGLGVVPDMWIVKNRDYAVSWAVGFSDSSFLGGTSNYLSLNTTGATATYNNLWGSSPANSSTITMAGDRSVNISGDDYVAYFFKAKQGYSKFGKYVGNGNADGPFVYTGFKPAFVMVKRIDTAGYHWRMHDSTRDPFNVSDKRLTANSSDAEASGSSNYHLDILSNGFKWRTNFQTNVNGGTYIYMAFAENPFVAGGVPTTAR